MMKMYSDEEKKAIEYLKKHIIPCYENSGRIEFFLNDILLNLIEKQFKLINEMVEWIENEQNNKVDGQYTSGSYMLTAEEIIQYFENEIREDK